MIRATITFVKPYADFVIEPESDYRFYYETLTLSEAVVLVTANYQTESLTLSEVQALTHNKVIPDAFTLDDAALVNKNYTGVKGNVFGFTDVIVVSKSSNQALGNMLLGSLTLN